MRKEQVKKVATVVLGSVMMLGLFAGCGSASGNSGSAAKSSDKGAVSGTISVVSRENGSGTRGAFVELTGVEEKDADGNKTDNTVTSAIIANSTDVVINNVAGDSNAIGYVSLGTQIPDSSPS